MLSILAPGGRGPGTLYRRAQSLAFLATRDRSAVLSFLASSYPASVTWRERASLVRSFIRTTDHVRAYHTQAELLRVADRILSLSGRSGLTILEAGAGKGASTAKLSLATARAGGRLLVLDSFRGIPANDEVHRHLDGRTIRFRAGAFVGRLESVKRTVAEFGAIEVCTFKKGLFSETLPTIEGPIDVALLDVDLLSSTRDCVRALYPRLRPGGALFSQDGHLRGIVEMLADPKFWRGEVGVEPPSIPGLGRDKLLEIVKPYSRWARR